MGAHGSSSPPGQDAARPIPQRCPNERLRRRGLTARNADSWVFAAPAGGPLLYSHFRRPVWLPAVRSAELEELTFHSLRHAAATAWVAAGIDLRTAQHRLGHATPRLILELYAHATSEADRVPPPTSWAPVCSAVATCSTRVARHRRAMESPGGSPHHVVRCG
ncbi:MAG: tyrosine-type recombinase/integrase [Acidimicrobiia bacterium]